MDRLIAELLARPDVAAAREWIEWHDARTLSLQHAIATIPAPTFDEGRRGAFIAERLVAIGLKEVSTDEVGNVSACLGGNGPGVIVCSHLDTVFPSGTPLKAPIDGTRIRAPGIGDNARGLAALLTLAEACITSGVQLSRPITFLASVGEEGQGDLRGVKHYLDAVGRQPSAISAFVALDGPGLDRIVHRALGSIRLRATYKGPGGHSWAAFGVANPAHAVGIATARIADIALPASPRASLSVVRIGGGHSLNTIPMAAWLELDLRAESHEALKALDESVKEVLQRALEQVNRTRLPGTNPLALDVTPLGERPSGTTDEHHPLVQAALAATRALGATPALAAASTDANVPISRGIPGIALGAGGKGGDAHLLSEWYENVNGPAGIVRCLLVALAVGR